MPIATNPEDPYWSPKRSKLFASSSSSRQYSVPLVPVRLDINEVEKNLQEECRRDIAFKSKQQEPKPPPTFDLESLLKTGIKRGALPLFPSTATTTAYRLPSTQGTKPSLKRFKRTPLFKDTNYTNHHQGHSQTFVLDIPAYISSYQHFQQWQPQPSNDIEGMSSSQELRNYVEDILEEVLGETDYSSRNRIIALPTTASSTVTSPIMPTSTDRTSRSPTPIATTVVSAIQATQNTHPINCVPVFATSFQLNAVEQEVGRLRNNASSPNKLKHRIAKIIDIFNHPLHAMIPGYSSQIEGKGAGVHCGSGKTLFIHQLASRLEERGQVFNLALVCHDLNMEGFLLDMFKSKYPVTRLNTVIKGYWQKEYGVVLCIQPKRPGQPVIQQSSFTNKVHLVISTDLRIQHDNPVMTMFEHANGSPCKPPAIILMTMWSAEERLMEYTLKLTTAQNDAPWQIPDQESCLAICDTSKDTPVEGGQRMTAVVVDNILQWIESDTSKPFLLAPILKQLHGSKSQLPTQPEPASLTQTEPEAPTEPEPPALAEPGPAAPTQSEPPAPKEPEPPAPTQPELLVPTRLEPPAPTDPELQAPTQPETQVPTQPEPAAPTQPEIAAPTRPELAAPTQPEPEAPTHPQLSPQEQQQEDLQLEQEDDELPLFEARPEATVAKTMVTYDISYLGNETIRHPSTEMDVDHEDGSTLMQIDTNTTSGKEEQQTSTQSPIDRDDLTKLFSHVSIDQLHTSLKKYISSHNKSSKEHFTTTSDEDSFYSAESETVDDLAASCVNEVLDKYNHHHQESEEDEVAMANMLKTLKLQFDEKCLDLLSSMVQEYQDQVEEMQKKFVDEAGLILNISRPS